MTNKPMEENEMEPQQQIIQPEKYNLDEKVARILREDIQGSGIRLRQPPINDDDADNWSQDKGVDSWLYVASTLIEVVRRWDRPPGESDTPQ
jgi:hypothetical protein